jgi:hypothetical protein
MDNLIDLGNYPRNDVELISREFMRVVYLDVCKDYATEVEKEDKDEAVIKNIEDLIRSIEMVIIMLDGNDDFLKFITSGEEESESEEDEEYDRF